MSLRLVEYERSLVKKKGRNATKTKRRSLQTKPWIKSPRKSAIRVNSSVK